MAEPDAADLRQRLLEIDEELNNRPGDDPARDRLLDEADRLRVRMEELAGPEIEAARKRWAVRAGRKGSHTDDPVEAKARIVSPHERGG